MTSDPLFTFGDGRAVVRKPVTHTETSIQNLLIFTEHFNL